MPNTVEGWRGLLGVLTDEELEQYGRMAMDQVQQEVRRARLHMLMLVAAMILMGWAGWTIYHVGELGWLVYLALAVAGLLVYIPWRSVKTRKLWLGHYARVKEERSRRQSRGNGA